MAVSNEHIIKKYGQEFKIIFEKDVSEFLNEFGFNTTKFILHNNWEEEEVSLKECIRKKYGEYGVTLIEFIIKGK